VSEVSAANANGTLPLPVVDAQQLPLRVREALRPGDELRDRSGLRRRLPRFFYEVDSWNTALQVQVAPNFCLWEFMGVDVRETAPLRSFPRYVPCTVTALAAHLAVFRQAVGTFVHVAANGGYRSPGHQLSRHASRHCWGSAANIYRIGDDDLDDEERITRYAQIARAVLPAAWVRPWGHGDGESDDHLHIDLGYMLLEPVELKIADEPDHAATRI
jgi:hypothetical protein